MTLQQAIEIVEYHQVWRRGADIPFRDNSKDLGLAIDMVLQAAKKQLSHELDWETLYRLGLSDFEWVERETLMRLRASKTRWFSQQEFDRLAELNEKLSLFSGKPTEKQLIQEEITHPSFEQVMGFRPNEQYTQEEHEDLLEHDRRHLHKIYSDLDKRLNGL